MTMIVELLVIILTPLATYNILRAFNVSKPPAVVVSLIYTILLFEEFTWIMLIYGSLATMVAIRLLFFLLRVNLPRRRGRKTQTYP